MISVDRVDNTRPHKGYTTVHFTDKTCAIIYWYSNSVRFYDFKISREPETVDFDVLMLVNEMIKINE